MKLRITFIICSNTHRTVTLVSKSFCLSLLSRTVRNQWFGRWMRNVSCKNISSMSTLTIGTCRYAAPSRPDTVQDTCDSLTVVFRAMHNIQHGPKKWGHKLMSIILSNLNQFTKKIHWKILVNLQYTCSCIFVRKQSINDKLQGNVAIYFIAVWWPN